MGNIFSGTKSSTDQQLIVRGPSPGQRLTEVRGLLMRSFGFWDLPSMLTIARRVCQAWNQAIGALWLWKDYVAHPIPRILEILGPSLSYEQMVKDIFPHLMGKEFYKKYLGDVGSVSEIPHAFIKWAYLPDPFGEKGALIQANYQLVWIPDFITVTLPTHSPLTLSAGGRLIEDPSAAVSERRVLRVPVTINNISKLTERCLKLGTPIMIGLRYSLDLVLNQYGDTPASPHWAFLKKAVVTPDLPYSEQKQQIEKVGLEVASLIDWVIYELLRMSTGAGRDNFYFACTSTPILCGTPSTTHQTGTWCPVRSTERLILDAQRTTGHPFLAVAVGVSAGSSKVIDS
jgi:hypothetical protein